MMSKPRICIAISTFYPIIGGAERQALIQAKMLHLHDYQVMVVTFRQKYLWPSYELVEGVPVFRIAGRFLSGREHRLPLIKRACYLLGLWLLFWKLWCKRDSYDVLHVYHLNAFALPAALAAWLAHKSLIVGIRSASTDPQSGSEETLSLLAGPLEKDASWLHIPGVLQLGGDLNDVERLGPFVMRITHALLSRPHVVVAILSSFMYEYLENHHFCLPNIQLIPNGVDIQRFSPTSSNEAFEERAQRVVCVSKLCYRKGSDVLLQAWRYVQKEFPTARLRLIGDGPIHAQLQRMAHELGIAHTVEFVGLQKDVPAQLRQAGIVVLPSRIEGMPNALLEAMACGLPCVATRVSGSEDIIQSGVNGLLVESEDYQALAKALLSLLRDPALAASYGQAARVRIEECYSLERVTNLYFKLYQQLFEKQRCADKQRYWKHYANPLRRGCGRILRYVWNSRVC